MYIQLTTRCSMACPHCIYSCTAQGEDMSHGVFYAAMMLAARWGQFLILGGGEPTLAPEFPRMLEDLGKWLLLDGMGGLEGAWMATNGTRKRNTFLAIRLMEELEELGQPEKFAVVLSANDGFHDDAKIHPDVWSYFWARERRFKAAGKFREVLRSVRRILPVGRARENAGILSGYFPQGWESQEPECACDDWHVKPDGSIRACGCPDAPTIGNVYFPQSIDERYSPGRCYREKVEVTKDEIEEVISV